MAATRYQLWPFFLAVVWGVALFKVPFGCIALYVIQTLPLLFEVQPCYSNYSPATPTKSMSSRTNVRDLKDRQGDPSPLRSIRMTG